MIKSNIIPLRKSINKAFLKIKPVREDFDNFKNELQKLLLLINDKESEEHNKNFVRDFLINTFYSKKYVNTKGRTDLAIHLDKKNSGFVGAIIEVKSPVNKPDMISESNLNCKAMHEVVLYYLRERTEHKNDEIKSIIITNVYEWFIFKADQFEKYFYKSRLKDEYEKWRDDKKVSKLNDHFYNEVVKNYLDESDTEIEYVHFDLRDFQSHLAATGNEKELIPLFKKFTAQEILKESFANDSNTLNKQFYAELLHIIGLEEFKDGSKKKIGRKDDKERDNGSLIENTIRMLKSKDFTGNFSDISIYGDSKEQQLYNIALELNIIWINRVLFLKLLEAQLVNYHRGNNDYKFLDPKVISQYDDLYELFHEVLAIKIGDRNPDLIGRFGSIPYLNSSLFEMSDIEKKTIDISNLKDRYKLPFYRNSVFNKEAQAGGELHTLEYLLRFLDAYDFASEGGEEIRGERKTIINASVLGLIFEKINGYKDGSFYTPGFITMYMARETLTRTVVQKFNEAKSTAYKDYEELKRNMDISSAGREEVNKIINDIKICDPAVGSGHFLVSCLNEIISIKADLKILSYMDGRQVQNYSFEIEHDELIITNEETDELFDYHLSPSGKPVTALQDLQETLFHEKETIIENCLFGVDINPNSVNICSLRLWIELLKNSYYRLTPQLPSLTRRGEGGELELITLPNIDINIKQGNSLISRFKIDEDMFTSADKSVLEVYKLNVTLYKNEQDKNKRHELKVAIENTKERFRGIAVDPLYKEREQMDKLTTQLHKLNVDNPLFKHEDTAEKETEIKKKKNILVEKINKLSKEIEAKAEEYRTIYSGAFEWRFEFPEVLDEEGNYKGFDVVIGNPPYIRTEKIKEYSKYFYENYKVFNRGADIYFYFYELSYKILREKGKHCFINNTYDKTTAGRTLRSFVANNFSIIKYLDYTSVSVFEEATTYPIIILTEKLSAKTFFSYLKIENEVTKFDKEFYDTTAYLELDQNKLNEQVWNFDQENGIVNKLLTNKSLKDIYGKCYYGVKTALNEAFIVSHSFESTEPILKKVYEGKDIKRWFTTKSNKFMVVIENGFTSDKYGKIDEETAYKKISKLYPQVFGHLFPFKLKAKKRSDKGEYWWELRNCAYYDLFAETKIIFPNLQNENKFSWDESKSYINAPAVFLPTKDKSLLGILNSKLIWYFFKNICVVRNGGYIEVKPQYFEQVPILDLSEIEKKSITKSVDKILKQKKQNPKSDTTALEKEIDEMVYRLYGLTDEEKRIIEESFTL